jgi:hypothetical protein
MLRASRLEKNAQIRLEKESALDSILLKERKVLQKPKHLLFYFQSKHLDHKALLILPRLKEFLLVNTMMVKTS